jgi:hypothetical protein
MDLERRAFSYELCKIAQEKSKKKGYGAAFMATAPLAVAQAVGDFPKGYVDKKVEVAVAKGLKPAIKAKAWKVGTGRAVGRLVAGPATAPLFFSGVKDIKDGDRKKGYAKVLAASGVYAGAKGGIESAVEGGKKATKALSPRMKRIAATRGILGLGSGVITAGSIAEAQRKSSKLKGGKADKNRFLAPAAIGAGIGGAKGAIEGAMDPSVAKTVRGIGGKAAGRAASGVIGALAISEIARSLSKPKVKKASADKQPQIPTTSQIYSQVRVDAGQKPDQVLQDFLRMRPNPEKTPTSRAVTYAVNDELRSRGVPVQREKVRHQTYPPHKTQVERTNIAHTAAVAAVVASPSLVWSVGISGMKTPQKDMAIKDALERLAATEGIERIHAGIGSGGLINFNRPAEPFFITAGPEDIESLLEAHAESPAGSRQQAKSLARKISKGETKIISTSRGGPAGILAHEIGHATAGPARLDTIGSSTARRAMKFSMIPAVAVPLIVLNNASDRTFHTREEMDAKAKFVERVGLVSALLGAPGVAEEGVASVKGLQYMKRVGASNRQLARAAAVMLPGFATYAMPFAAAAVTAKILRSRSEMKREPRDDTR